MHMDEKTHFIFALDLIKLNFSKDEPLIMDQNRKIKKREKSFVCICYRSTSLFNKFPLFPMCEPFKIICNIMALKLSG